MTDDSMMTAIDPARAVADVTALRRWLREHEDNAKRLHAEIDALRRLLHRGIDWPCMSMTQAAWVREVKALLDTDDDSGG